MNEDVKNEMSGPAFLETFGPIINITVRYNELDNRLMAFFHTESIMGYFSNDACRILLNVCAHTESNDSGCPISDVVTKYLKFADISYYDNNNNLQTCPTLYLGNRFGVIDECPYTKCGKAEQKYWQDKINKLIKIENDSRQLAIQIEECGGMQWEEEVIDYDWRDYETGETEKVISVLGKCTDYGCYYLASSNSNHKVYVPIHRYSFIDHFGGAYSRVNIEDKTTGKKKWGIINWYGKEVVPVIYDEIWKFFGKDIQNVKLIQNSVIKWFNRNTGWVTDEFPPIQKESIDYELGNSDRDNFYAMTDGAEGEYEDVYDIDYYDD